MFTSPLKRSASADSPMRMSVTPRRLFGNPTCLWETDRMTNQQQSPQHREECKIQKLVERIEMQQALRAKAIREAAQPSLKN
jgi:hypothetical protein